MAEVFINDVMEQTAMSYFISTLCGKIWGSQQVGKYWAKEDLPHGYKVQTDEPEPS